MAMFVKICGITTEEDALLAVALGADAVGFIFAVSSRQLTPLAARDIARRLPSETLAVGVFKGQSPQQVVDIVHEAGLKAAQLHDYTPAQAQEVARQVPRVISAFAAGNPAIDRFDEYGSWACHLDAPAPGSGEVFDWRLAEGLPSNRRVILAGGLNPDNVADGIRTVRPFGVDVATGVEASPGKKDRNKMRRFIEVAKMTGAELSGSGGDGSDTADDGPYDWMEE